MLQRSRKGQQPFSAAVPRGCLGGNWIPAFEWTVANDGRQLSGGGGGWQYISFSSCYRTFNILF